MNVTLFCLVTFRPGNSCSGARERRSNAAHPGEHFPVRAEIRQLQSSPSRRMRARCIAWMRNVPAPPPQVFTAHGEAGASDALRQRIERELGWAVLVPEHLQSFGVSSLLLTGRTQSRLHHRRASIGPETIRVPRALRSNRSRAGPFLSGNRMSTG